MRTLSDFPSLIGTPSMVTVHGLGKGGGEKVVEKLKTIYGKSASQLRVIRSNELSYRLMKEMQRHGASEMMLLTAGIRELPNMFKALLAGQQFAVYVQVPYLHALSWRDPLHAMSVLLYLLTVSLFARTILVNSQAVAAGMLKRKVKVVLPFTFEELQQCSVLSQHRAIAEGEPLRLNLVCRLALERGRGSRDIGSIMRLLRECASHNEGNSRQLRVHHYGECDPAIREKLLEAARGCLTLHGHTPNWVEQAWGPLVLLSHYEGFGLAAFEAARAGWRVYANEAFPEELFEVCREVRRLHTRNASPLLVQFEELA